MISSSPFCSRARQWMAAQGMRGQPGRCHSKAPFSPFIQSVHGLHCASLPLASLTVSPSIFCWIAHLMTSLTYLVRGWFLWFRACCSLRCAAIASRVRCRASSSLALT